MVRTRQRKPIEELYGSKFDTQTATAPKSQVNSNSLAKTLQTQRTDRTERTLRTDRTERNDRERNDRERTVRNERIDRDFNNGYIITSNCPVTATSNPQSTNNPYAANSRRKSSRPPPVKTERLYVRDETKPKFDMIKKEPPNVGCMQKAKTMRAEKCCYPSTDIRLCDPKTQYIFSDNSAKDMLLGESAHRHDSHHMHGHHGHHHAHHNNSVNSKEDDDKDDDPEEFFDLIRQTVQSAIGTSVSELINRNFRELGGKIDRFSTELKQTNDSLRKLKEEVCNKVVHYGEENSRHFRYLCMKSEYDKMFYQHHTMIATKTPTTPTNTQGTASNSALLTTSPSVTIKGNKADIRKFSSKSNQSSDCAKAQNNCKCRSTPTAASPTRLAGEPHKVSSDERSVGNKSSELGMREVLEHIQRFCTQMQLGDGKSETKINKDDFPTKKKATQKKIPFHDLDDYDFHLSSDDDDDDLTPRSEDDDNEPNYRSYGSGNMTARPSSRPSARASARQTSRSSAAVATVAAAAASASNGAGDGKQ